MIRRRDFVPAIVLGALYALSRPTAQAQTSPSRPPPATQPAQARTTADPQELDRCFQLLKAGQTAVARTRLETVVRDHPKWARATLYLALTYHLEHRYELARPLFAKALELDPQEHKIRPFYGWCLYYLGRVDESQEMFEAYLKVQPEYADAHYAIGLIEYERDAIDKAKERFEKTVALAVKQKDAPVEGKAHARLGDVYVRLDDLPKAKQELDQAVKLRPDAYEAYFKLSRVLQRLGDEDGAKKAREKFKEVKARVRPETAKQPD